MCGENVVPKDGRVEDYPWIFRGVREDIYQTIFLRASCHDNILLSMLKIFVLKTSPHSRKMVVLMEVWQYSQQTQSSEWFFQDTVSFAGFSRSPGDVVSFFEHHVSLSEPNEP